MMHARVTTMRRIFGKYALLTFLVALAVMLVYLLVHSHVHPRIPLPAPGVVAISVLAAMAVMMVTWPVAIAWHRARAPGPSPGSVLDVLQEGDGLIGLGADELMPYVLAALERIGARTTRIAPGAPTIVRARTGWSWDSHGERIDVSLRRVSDAETEVRVTSRPVLRLTFTDGGRNFRNVMEVMRALGLERP